MSAVAPDVDDHQGLVEGLLEPGAYPRPPERVELIETHLSWVFLAGERVYKVKKPVDLGFVDQRDPAERRRLCHEELRLNRRLAPDVYRAVVPVLREGEGWRVAAERPDDGRGAPGAAVFAVEMVRLPAQRMLGAVLEAGALDNQLMEDLARLLVDFHGRAASGPEVSRWGTPEAVGELLLGNLDELSPFVGAGGDDRALTCLSPIQQAFLRRTYETFLDDHAGLLARRVDEGRLREGHGDLHAGNLCLTADGPVAYDALEFSAAFRCGDVALDLAFLLMDLDRSGFSGFARYLQRRYAVLAGDTELCTLLPIYKTHRALVRAKVTCLRAGGEQGATRAASLAEARAYALLAVGYHLPARALVLCGGVGSGKSWWARRLSAVGEAVVLRSDVMRKQLLGLSPLARCDEELEAGVHGPGTTERVYRAVLDEALTLLELGRSVVLDAGHGTPARRSLVLDTLRRLDHPVVLVHADTPRELAATRVAERAARGDDPSDAGPELFEALWQRFTPPDEVHDALLVRAPPDQTPEQVAALVVDRWIEQLA